VSSSHDNNVSGMGSVNRPTSSKSFFRISIGEKWPGTDVPISLVIISIAAVVFAFDVTMPLGVAGGVPYVALVLAGYGLRNRRNIYFLAILGTVLTFVGYFMSPDGGIHWVVMVNRGLALFAIWIAAFLTVSYKKIESGHRILSHAVSQSGDMVFITDTDGNITYVNTQFTKVTGYSEKEVLGKNPRILKSGNTPRAVYAKLWTDILAGRMWRGEIEDHGKDGRTFWAAARISPIRDRDGNITHFVAMHEDITQRKEAEQQLITAKAEAEVANRSKSEFIANMSHELRTPLNAIIGFSNILQNETFGALVHEKQREYVNDIIASGEHLLELINDILDVSAIEANSLNVCEDDIDVPKIANASVRLINPRAEEGHIEVINKITAPLPLLRADERRLKQILLNLLTNAVKFTPENGRVVLNATIDDVEGLIVRVEDTGIGMTPEELAKALTKFGQVDSKLSRKHEGSGLGLTLASGLAEALGGRLDIVSTKGQGTTAILTFPPDRVVPSSH